MTLPRAAPHVMIVRSMREILQLKQNGDTGGYDHDLSSLMQGSHTTWQLEFDRAEDAFQQALADLPSSKGSCTIPSLLEADDVFRRFLQKEFSMQHEPMYTFYSVIMIY